MIFGALGRDSARDERRGVALQPDLLAGEVQADPEGDKQKWLELD